MTRRPNRAATAYHEAGHAVVAWRLGFKVRRVTITPGEDHDGFAEHDSPLRGIHLDIDNSDRARLRAEKAIMICLAGTLAQRRFAPRSVRLWQGESDRDLATDLALRINGSGEAATAFLAWLNLRTADLIEAAWDSVEALAGALLEHRTLDARAAKAAMDAPITEALASRAARIGAAAVRVLSEHEMAAVEAQGRTMV